MDGEDMTDELENVLDSMVGVGYLMAHLNKELDDDMQKNATAEAKTLIKALIAKECNKARIEEMKLAKEWCSGAYLCDYVNILDRIKELSNKENE